MYIPNNQFTGQYILLLCIHVLTVEDRLAEHSNKIRLGQGHCHAETDFARPGACKFVYSLAGAGRLYTEAKVSRVIYIPTRHASRTLTLTVDQESSG